MWCEPEFHRAGHGKMFMENKENESLKISAKLVDLEDAEEFLKKSAIGKEKIKIAAGDKKSEKVSMEVPVAEKSENFQAREDNCEELNLQDYQLEQENRIRNLLWTISGDYTQQMKPDVSLFLRSKDIALYDGIKQGALAKFFDKDFLGMYLVKKSSWARMKLRLPLFRSSVLKKPSENGSVNSALGSGRCRGKPARTYWIRNMRLCRRQQISWAI